MGITVSYQPSAAAISSSAYQAGAGMYQQAMQEAQQRERMQIRSLAVQQQEAAINRQFQATQNEFQARDMFARDENRGQLQEQFQERAAEIARQRDKQQREWQIEDRIEQERAVRREQELRNADAMQADEMRFNWGQADGRKKLIDEALASGFGYTQQQQREVDQLQADIAKLESDDTLLPFKRAQLLAQAYSKMPLPTQRVTSATDRLMEEVGFFTHPETQQKIPMVPARSWNPIQLPEVDTREATVAPSQLFWRDPQQQSQFQKEILPLMQEQRFDENTGKLVPVPMTIKQISKAMQEFARELDAGASQGRSSGGPQRMPQTPPKVPVGGTYIAPDGSRYVEDGT